MGKARSSRQTQTSTQASIRIGPAFICDIVFYAVFASSCWPPVPFFCHFLPLFLSCRLFCWQEKKIKLHVLRWPARPRSRLHLPLPQEPLVGQPLGEHLEDLHAPGGRFRRLIFCVDQQGFKVAALCGPFFIIFSCGVT